MENAEFSKLPHHSVCVIYTWGRQILMTYVRMPALREKTPNWTNACRKISMTCLKKHTHFNAKETVNTLQCFDKWSR